MDTLDTTQESLNSRAKSASCLFWYSHERAKVPDPATVEIGTGFFVKYGKARYVISCQHVVCGFMSAHSAMLVPQYDDEKRLGHADVFSWAGLPYPYDVGYLRLKNEASLSELMCIGEDELERNAVDWNLLGSLLYGYPGDIVQVAKEGAKQVFQGFSLLGEWKRKEADDVRDTFEYPETDDAVIENALKIPDAPGLSGSPIWCFPRMYNTVIDFTKSKVAAIEHSWRPQRREYLGTPISYVLDLIDQREGE